MCKNSKVDKFGYAGPKNNELIIKGSKKDMKLKYAGGFSGIGMMESKTASSNESDKKLWLGMAIGALLLGCGGCE